MRHRSSSRPHESLPAQVYVSAVEALYSDARSLYAGSASAAAAAFVTYWKTGDWTLLVCAVLLGLIGIARGADMRSYAGQQSKPETPLAARRWEVRYILGSAAYVAVLGAWCFLAFARNSDAAVHLISFSVILAYMVGITGRNFGSHQLVVTQTVCAAVPMIAGLLIQQSPYYAFLALLLVPFFLSIRNIAARLRGILFNAVIATGDIKSLAMQFDTALNNMPHGLCMFDAEQRFVVANWRFEALLGLAPGQDRRGVSATDVLLECVQSGVILPSVIDRFSRGFMETLSAVHRVTLLSTETDDGRTLELTFQPMKIGGCVVLVEDITDRRRAEERIEQLARYDALTGLPNRTFLTEQFDAILGNGSAGVPRAVLFVDLDEFKQVNDTLGHPCGDALLCEVALRLREVVRETDVVARFGGDEFIVLQTVRNGHDDAAVLAGRIIERLSQIYDVDGHQIMVGASIGISLTPQDGVSADQLLKNADIALYRAKSEGRGGWRFFEPDMDAKAKARRTLEMDLREALAREEFEIHYQPIIDLKTGRPSTCEALLRWPHPRRGNVSPDEFIPAAEEMGLIVDIGRWVLNKACAECMKWPPHVRLAVNLSPIQFRRASIETTIRDALAATGLAPERLEIEITESVLLQDTLATRNSLQRIRDMGVNIALDDFGTGYSSLSYLQYFPLNKVKIDRSFLTGIESEKRAMTLLRGVARLSADLGMSVVVEGVETKSQLDIIAAVTSISEVQGFLFSAALPSAEVRKYLAADRIYAIKAT